MMILIRHYLRVEPDRDLEGLLKQYTEALWIEERTATLMQSAVAKAMGAK